MPHPRLEVFDQPLPRTVPIEKDLFTIGRRNTNDLRFQLDGISREHAEVARVEAGFVIRDKGSRFGTFLNDAPVSGPAALKHGDSIRLGQKGSGIEMRFLVDEARDLTASHPDPTKSSSWHGEFRQVAALLEALRALGSARVLDEVLALVIDSAIDLSRAQRGFIVLVDGEGRLEFKLGRARGRVTLPGRQFEASAKFPEQVYRTGQTVMVRDLQEDDMARDHAGTVVIGIRQVFCVPLRLVRLVEQAEASVEQKRIGVLYLDSQEAGSLSSESVRSGLELLATEAAVAIENAKLYREAVEKARMEQEMRIAGEIQHALLPAPEWESDYFEAMGRTVPCRAIGGDFFEYLTMKDGSSAFIVADVSGKGAPAALLTAVIQGVLATQTAFGGGPAEAIARVNEVLIRRALGSRFVTIFFAALSADGRLTCCNAGHNPPFLVSRSGIRRLSVGGLICGLFENAVFEEETVTLESGDCLAIFSDGISEALNATGEEFGDDRILACLTREPGRTVGQMLECLVTTVKAFAAGTVQSDDMTAIVMRYKGRG